MKSTVRPTSRINRRKLLISELASIPGLRPAVEPLGTFYLLAEVTGYGDASAFARDLLDSEQVGVMPAECFDAPGHVRISYVVDVARLLEALARIRRFAKTAPERNLRVPEFGRRL